jgi:hypothetical protein
VESALSTGRIAGQVEVVQTGERSRVGSAEDLVAFLLQVSGLEPELAQVTLTDELLADASEVPVAVSA